jgi:hypothetical protein
VHGLTPRRVLFQMGPVRPSKPEDRVPNTTPPSNICTRKVCHIMDLMADQTVDFRMKVTDEAGNPVDAPAGTTFTFSVDDPALINLEVDDDDLGGALTAVGPLGSTILHAVGALNGTEITADEAINVIAGNAERVSFEFGEPTEATPDQ